MTDATRHQSWSADGYAHNARFVSDLGDGVLRLLAPQPGERILDVGCGDGALTLKIAAAGASVTGIDASPAFVARARERGIDAHEGDAHRLAYQNAFDAVFSNAALHWMNDHDAVLARVHRALRSGGRFVAEMGGHGNVAAIVVAISAVLANHGIDASARSPWTFPSVEGFRTQLEGAGFDVDRIELFARPTALPTGIEGWLATFAQPFFGALDESARADALGATVAILRPVLCDRAGRWTADYVRLRFAARKPAGPLA